MSSNRRHEAIARVLRKYLEAVFSGLEVEVTRDARWSRPVVILRWSGFVGLMAEQRFHLVLRAIPPKVMEHKLAGLVWFELTPVETPDDYLKMPRCEDVADREAELAAALARADVFKRLSRAMGQDPPQACDGTFNRTRRILEEAGVRGGETDDVCLLLIRHGAYCDCQVLTTARTGLEGVTDGTGS